MDDQVSEHFARMRRFGCSLTGSFEQGDLLAREAYAVLSPQLSSQPDDEPGSKQRLNLMLKTLYEKWKEGKVRSGGQLPAIEIGPDQGCCAESRCRPCKVRALFDTLPEEQRSVMLLVCVDGLGYRETAEIVGIPFGEMVTRLAKGRLALAKGCLIPATSSLAPAGSHIPEPDRRRGVPAGAGRDATLE